MVVTEAVLTWSNKMEDLDWRNEEFYDNDAFIPLDAYGQEEGEVESLDVVGDLHE